MKVGGYNTRIVDGRKRVSAQIEWENTDRPGGEIYYEVEEQYSEALSCNNDAFFLATLIPAIYYGEKNYQIEGEVSPELLEGTKEVLGWLNHWYYEDKREDIMLEVSIRSRPEYKSQSRSAAWLLSGGIDSYATYYNNRAIYDKEHPRYFKDGIVAYGLETADTEKFAHVLSKLEPVADELGVNLITLYTNIYLIYRGDERLHEHELWRLQFQGAVLASLGHVLTNRVHSLSIPSSASYNSDLPYGTHPLIDRCFNTENLQINHDSFRFSRFEKTKLVGEHINPDFFIRVCNDFRKYDQTHFNCGNCDKCLHTMMAFLVQGKLAELKAFPYKDVTAEMIKKHALRWNDDEIDFFEELMKPLEEVGREDLSKAIHFAIRRYNRKAAKNKIKSTVMNIDENYFNGNIQAIKQSLKKISRLG